MPENYPNEKNRQQIDPTKKVIVCFGDSNTHGNVSYNWVNDLSSQLIDYQIFNAGINSDLTYTLLRRIDDVIACKPDFITILIGTNDVNSTMHLKIEKRYQQLGRIDKIISPNFEDFKKNYIEIINQLKQKTKAKIAIMSLPVMGEDLSHEANLRADKYSDFIKQLATDKQVSYLPVREKQKEFLLKNPKPLKHRFEETYKLLNFSVISHYLLGKTWDEITTKHGFQLTPDNLHQNSIAGGMIRDLIIPTAQTELD
ncbi:SGNH/GDSL hydrolase family protein [Emticicia sp.]|uniref:SGNH/GDSL hydrolase family protein n=1 Tax=Emticicia sp. TaxID=1930953 RepID=UPI0037511F1E